MVVRAAKGDLRPIKHTTTLDLLRKEKRMRVRMLIDLNASFDGANVQKLKMGESYDVPEAQAQRWLDKKIAAEDKAIDPPKEIKARPRVKRAVRRKAKK